MTPFCTEVVLLSYVPLQGYTIKAQLRPLSGIQRGSQIQGHEDVGWYLQGLSQELS